MRAGLVLAAALAAGACNRAAGPTGQTADPAAPPRPAPAVAIGQSSGLTGQTSTLSGDVSGFLVARSDTATVVTLAADTLFAFDKADLTPGAIANLQRTAELVRAGGEGAVLVTGHTDAKGDDAYNLALSERRAAAVAAWLKQQAGIGGRTYTVEGKGEGSPAAPNARADGSDDPEGRARNRRVEVTIPR